VILESLEAAMRTIRCWFGLALLFASGCWTPERVVEHGALGPKALLVRAGKAIDAGDRELLIACMVPESAAEEQQAAAERMADYLLLGRSAKAFFHRMIEKFGRDAVQDAYGNATAALFPLTVTPHYGYVADKGEIEIEGDRATASVDFDPSQRGLRKMRVIVYRHADDRWYLFGPDAAPGKSPFAPERRQAVADLLEESNVLLELSDSAAEFEAKVAPRVEEFCQAVGIRTRGRLRVPGPKDPKPKDAFASDTEDAKQRAIEWVFYYGGKIEVAGEKRRFVKNAEDLPPEPFEVVSAELTESPVPGEELAHLQAFPELEVLSIDSYRLTDAGVEHLAGLEKLKHLRLGKTQIEGTGLAHLKASTQLESLSLAESDLQDDGLVHLKPFPRLRELNLRSTILRGPGLAHLAGLTALEKLSLRSTTVGDEHLQHLAELAELAELDLYGTRVGDDGLKTLAALEKLDTLVLYGTRISDQGLAHLGGHELLRELDLGRTPVTGSGFRHLAELPKLEKLQLAALKIEPGSLRSIGKCRQLKSLACTRSSVDDAAVAHLAGLDRLERLDLSATKLTDAGAEHLTKLSSLTHVNLSNTQVTDAAIPHLEKLPNLKSVSLSLTKVTQPARQELLKKLQETRNPQPAEPTP